MESLKKIFIMRLIQSLDFSMNLVVLNCLFSKDQVFYIPQLIAVFFVFDKGSLFVFVCCLLIWNMDCLSSKDPVLHILHAWAYSMCLIGSLSLV